MDDVGQEMRFSHGHHPPRQKNSSPPKCLIVALSFAAWAPIELNASCFAEAEKIKRTNHDRATIAYLLPGMYTPRHAPKSKLKMGSEHYGIVEGPIVVGGQLHCVEICPQLKISRGSHLPYASH